MSTYHEEMKLKETKRLREIQQELPPFTQAFFRGIAQTVSPKSRLAYAYDLRIFFRYLYEEHRTLGGVEPKDFTVECLNEITAEDIDCFMEYLSYYIRPDHENPEYAAEMHNDEKGKSRKLAAIRSMFKFYYKKNKIAADPAALVDTPKIHEKTITRLDVNEVANLLDAVETGEKLSGRQKAFHERTKKRDLALTTLLLGTGMRVSECVGINIRDLDFQNNAVRVTRKGGNEVFLFFGEEVREALEDYLEERKTLPKCSLSIPVHPSKLILISAVPSVRRVLILPNSCPAFDICPAISISVSMIWLVMTRNSASRTSTSLRSFAIARESFFESAASQAWQASGIRLRSVSCTLTLLSAPSSKRVILRSDKNCLAPGVRRVFFSII